MRAAAIWELSTSTQLYCKPKTALKIKSIKKRKRVDRNALREFMEGIREMGG